MSSCKTFHMIIKNAVYLVLILSILSVMENNALYIEAMEEKEHCAKQSHLRNIETRVQI